MTKSLILLLGLVLAAQCADVRIFGSTKMFVKDGIYTLFMFIDHKKEFYSYLIAYLWILDDVTVITDGDGISFFVIGDWGGLPTFPYRYEINYMLVIVDLCLINCRFRTIIEQLTSKLMNELSQTYNTKFQLAIGDNFYFTGVKDANDRRFKVGWLLLLIVLKFNVIIYCYLNKGNLRRCL